LAASAGGRGQRSTTAAAAPASRALAAADRGSTASAPASPTAVSFYADLYGGLASGLDVGSATRLARERSRIRGEPPAVWASVAVVGRGDAVFEPLLPPLERWLLRILSGLVVAAMATAALAYLRTQWQGRRPPGRTRIS
ncbi:MAG: hypothetical protein AAFX50_03400, partial [Acidobacteriota bacterium]